MHFHRIPIPKFIEGTVIYERGEEGTIAAYLYTWDGNALSKCVQLHSVQYPGKWLIGMQVVARGIVFIDFYGSSLRKKLIFNFSFFNPFNDEFVAMFQVLAYIQLEGK